MMRLLSRKTNNQQQIHQDDATSLDRLADSSSGYGTASASASAHASASPSASGTRSSLHSAFSHYSSMSYCSTSSMPMAHLGFQGARHLHPERLPSAKRDRCVSLRVIDQNYEMIENIRKLATSLKRLDMSNIGIDFIENEVLQNLLKLEKLDISNNDLTEDSLPASMSDLHSLIELQINNNIFNKVPKIIRKLKNLSRLNIGCNQITAIKETVDKLRRLTSLVCDNNQLKEIVKEIPNLRRLEILDASYNVIAEIPKSVKDFRVLKELNVSHNKLLSLPVEIFLLAKLESLNASCNQINRIPSVNIKGKVKRQITVVDLSENHLARFPEYLLLMVDELDISSNKVRKIPSTVFKKLEIRGDMILHLENNPIISPPSEICESGIKAMVQYFTEVKTKSKIYQGLKVLVFGSSGCGKTSLVQTMIDQQSRLADEHDKSIGVDAYWTQLDLDDVTDADSGSVSSLTSVSSNTSNILDLTIWDMSGDPYYRYPHYEFLEQPYLGLLVFNMAEYSNDNFKSMIGNWLDWIISKTNKVYIIIIGAKRDKVRVEPGQTRVQKELEICNDVMMSCQNYIKAYKESIESDIHVIESKPSISKSMSEELQANMIVLKSLEINIYPEIIPVSSFNLNGLDTLQKSIHTMAMNKEYFPGVMKTIPSMWGQVEEYIEDKGNDMQMPVMEWNKYEEVITTKFGMKHLLGNITNYLHEMGKVLWFSQHYILKKYVILRPSWFMDFLKMLLRHDFESTVTFTHDDTFRLMGIGQSQFNRFKSDFVHEGIAERDFMKALWTGLIPTELNTPINMMVQLLVAGFEMAYPIRRTGKDGNWLVAETKAIEEELESYYPKKEHFKVYKSYFRVVVPWENKVSVRPEYVTKEWELLNDRHRVVVHYRFPQYYPPGFFERCIVRAHHPKHELTFLEHWQRGIYGLQVERQIRFLLTFSDRSYNSSQPYSNPEIILDVRHQEEVGLLEIALIWKTLLPLLRDIDSLISQFAGLRIERRTECPLCRMPCFLGEWLTCKEFQSASTKQCPNCQKLVGTPYLVQPREKKSASELLLQLKKTRNIRLMKAQKEEETSIVDQDKGTAAPTDVTKENESKDSTDAGYAGAVASLWRGKKFG